MVEFYLAVKKINKLRKFAKKKDESKKCKMK